MRMSQQDTNVCKTKVVIQPFAEKYHLGFTFVLLCNVPYFLEHIKANFRTM